MHELWCGDFCDSCRIYELHELCCGVILSIIWGHGILYMHRLCSRYLRYEHGIVVMCSM